MFSLCLSAIVCGKVLAEPRAAVAEKPNIVLIYTDDQSYGDVSALNPEAKFRPPNLDRLINEGWLSIHKKTQRRKADPCTTGLQRSSC